jgi:hypothetical protein
MNKIAPFRTLMLFFLIGLLAGLPQAAAIPVTRMIEPDGPAISYSTASSWRDGFEQFRHTVVNGKGSVLVGVYAPQDFAFPVVQQPDGNANYVATEPDTVTQFSAPSSYGTVGLLAHDNLAGAQFYKLQPGETFFLVYGDGSIKPFLVQDIRQFQALQPTDPYSNFVDLEKPGAQLTSADVFAQIYTQPNQAVLQTCLERDGDPSWGRTFVIAAPRSLSSILTIPLYRNVLVD